jgi:formamidopyrimidine-DNA glycosylase
MPELPEIETLKLYMAPRLGGRIIDSVEVKRNKLREDCFNLQTITTPQPIKEVRRIAKYLIFDLGNEQSLLVHLGMSGRLTLQTKPYSLKKHDHIIFHLNSNECLVFNDTRRFGMIYYLPTKTLNKEKIFSHLGIEPLDESFDINYLRLKLQNRTLPIKNALMDNKIVVGIGNIYAAESLYEARISPIRPASNLSETELAKLVAAIKKVLSEAIKMGGTTLRDFVSGDNSPGYFKQRLMVYSRWNMPCYICKTTIVKIRQSGRSTFYCPNCQK